MALGFRYSRGITVAQSCQKALMHYSLVADVVMDDLTYGGGGAKGKLLFLFWQLRRSNISRES